MGCDEVRTMVEDDPSANNNICRAVATGLLRSDLNFTDTIIYNQQDLDDKLRIFIPTKIQKKDTNTTEYNTKDDILTNSITIDFDKQCLLAINGVNRVFRVEEGLDGDYVIFHDNLPGSPNQYIALVVKKLNRGARIVYATPKVPSSG